MTRLEDALRRLKLARAEGSAAPMTSPIATTVETLALEERAIPSAAELTEYRGKPLKLDPQALRANGFLLAGDRAMKLADELRLIKRPILKLLTATGDEKTPRGNAIMVASSSPGEGKTFVSVNLAQSLAIEQDYEVLLIDGDFKKRDVTRLFGLSEEPGFLDVIAGDAQLADVVHPTDQPRLAVVPAGRYRENANELLGSHWAAECVRACLNDPRRIVLFDSAPVLYSSEAEVVAGLTGQVVFVVRAGVTTKRSLADALDKLGTSMPRNIVLNDADSVIFAAWGGASSFYGYYGNTNQKAEAPAVGA